MIRHKIVCRPRDADRCRIEPAALLQKIQTGHSGCTLLRTAELPLDHGKRVLRLTAVPDFLNGLTGCFRLLSPVCRRAGGCRIVKAREKSLEIQLREDRIGLPRVEIADRRLFPVDRKIEIRPDCGQIER